MTSDIHLDEQYLLLHVGGIPHYVERSVLLRYPDSFFAKLITSPFKETSDPVITIQRNGKLFRYVYDYMYYGTLPRDKNGMTFLSADELCQVQDEAEFYQLPELVQECQNVKTRSIVHQHLNVYKSFDKQVESVKHDHPINTVFFREGFRAGYDALYWRGDSDESIGDEATDDSVEENKDRLLWLLASLKPVLPWIVGTIPESYDTKIYKSTTIRNVNIDEILQAAVPSPFGQGKCTRYDPTVRDSMEIPAGQLEDLTDILNMFDIAAMAPKRQLVLKPYKLVVYKTDGHFDEHRDTVREENHIGTLVLILQSDYTGGELQLDHGGQSVSVTGGGNWVAMYGDVVHQIQPVTSGSRVSLIFDIVSLPLPPKTKKVFGETPTESMPAVDDTTPIIDSKVCEQLYSAIDKQLEKYRKLSICLRHLYPSCQAHADFMKGADQALYDALANRYEVTANPIFVSHTKMHNEETNYKEVVTMDFEEFRLPTEDFEADEYDRRKFQQEKGALFVPRTIKYNNILFYDPEIGYTGNEADAEKAVYLVTALSLRNKVDVNDDKIETESA